MTNTVKMLREALERMAHKSNHWTKDDFQHEASQLLSALAATAQAPEPEQQEAAAPVAQVEDWPDDIHPLAIVPLVDLKTLPVGTKLYTSPPPAQQEAAGAIICNGLPVEKVQLDAACRFLKEETAFDGEGILEAWNKLVKFYVANIASLPPAPQTAQEAAAPAVLSEMTEEDVQALWESHVSFDPPPRGNYWQELLAFALSVPRTPPGTPDGSGE